jgi:hypothetical protein
MTRPAEQPARRFDRVSALLALITSVALVSAGWMRFGPGRAVEPLSVGATLPALRLLDPATREPLVLLGLRGKVVWLTFWSASAPTATARADLDALETVWKRFKTRSKFAMAAVAIDADRPEAVRSLLATTRWTLPVYLAAPETRQAFGADAARLPLHLLVDPTGQILATAQGQTLGRLTDQAERALDQLEPLGKTRFARND